MAFIYSLTDTWADAGVTFTAIKMNVTDSASASGSLLMDLQVGGVSQFSVGKTGTITYGTDAVLRRSNSSTTDFVQGLNLRARISGNTFSVNTLSFGNVGGVPTVYLEPDAADTLAQRRSTNAQTFRVYNTFTDASNYERGKVEWASNVLRIGTEKAGTGTSRNLELQTDGFTRVTFTAAGGINFNPSLNQPITFPVNRTIGYGEGNGGGARFGLFTGGSTNGFLVGPDAQFAFAPATAFAGNPDAAFQRTAVSVVALTNATTGGASMQMTEMTAPAAPAANSVRIYAEDNGSGKTRLMARFATGAAQQLAIEP
jgi:hypothetical protein